MPYLPDILVFLDSRLVTLPSQVGGYPVDEKLGGERPSQSSVQLCPAHLRPTKARCISIMFFRSETALQAKQSPALLLTT
jgi:hypothetical protein